MSVGDLSFTIGTGGVGLTRNNDPCGSFNSPGKVLTESIESLDPVSSVIDTEFKLSRLNLAAKGEA